MSAREPAFGAAHPEKTLPAKLRASVSAPGQTLDALVKHLTPVAARLIGKTKSCTTGLHQDSRLIRPGDVFAARAGAVKNGLLYLDDAIRRGAVALLVERGAPVSDCPVPIIEVKDIRLAIALAAEAVYDFPSRSIRAIGITGTNGKTTTAWLLAHAIRGAGGRAARLGTLGYEFENDRIDSALTTPQADEIARYAARVRDRGGTHLVMEVSSHALLQRRVDAVTFAVAAFTNLTQDHLDYHGNMQAYRAAKLRLFTDLLPKTAVVSVDDVFGREIAAKCLAPVLTVSREREASVHPLEVCLDARGIRARIAVPSGNVSIESRLLGEHNLDNLLMALAIVFALGLDVTKAAAALERVTAVPGRLERCDMPVDDIVVLVDYAHTPDALSRVLRAVRGLADGEIVCVFGCGGDRDADKRQKMGDAVGLAADRAIVTNDNPRSERPEAIAEAIELGLRSHDIPYDVELDRACAIERAVSSAKSGDLVLIAGKGHEPHQIIGSELLRFDDRVEARRALARRRERLGR